MTLLSKKLLTRLKISFLIGITLLSSTHALAQSIVTQWNDVAIQAVRDTGFAPTKTARALAILNTCMYDAWATYDSQAKRTQLNISRITNSSNVGQSQTEAMSYAAYECLVDLFPGKDLTAYVDPTQDSDFYDLLTTLVNTAKYSHGVSTPAGVGHAAASAVLGYRYDDGSNQHGNENPANECSADTTKAYSDYTCYTPQNAPLTVNTTSTFDRHFNPDHWQPLIVGSNAPQGFLTPQWRLMTPYALSSGDQLRNTLEGPAPYPSEAYEEQAKEILNFSLHLNDKSKAIVEYWMNGPKSETPPGHWVLFAKFISDRDGNDLNKDIKMYFALTNAMLDASIAAWDAKFAFDYVRPISAIRFLFNGQTIHYWNGTTDAGNWMPYQTSNVVTPAFPEYVSGHSTFSFAAAETLKLFTSSDKFNNEVTIPAHSSSVEPSIPSSAITLHWDTFTAAASEAGISRRYGGIHFKDGDLQGRKLGKAIADIAWKKSLSYFNGSDGESKTRSGKE